MIHEGKRIFWFSDKAECEWLRKRVRLCWLYHILMMHVLPYELLFNLKHSEVLNYSFPLLKANIQYYRRKIPCAICFQKIV